MRIKLGNEHDSEKNEKLNFKCYNLKADQNKL